MNLKHKTAENKEGSWGREDTDRSYFLPFVLFCFLVSAGARTKPDWEETGPNWTRQSGSGRLGWLFIPLMSISKSFCWLIGGGDVKGVCQCPLPLHCSYCHPRLPAGWKCNVLHPWGPALSHCNSELPNFRGLLIWDRGFLLSDSSSLYWAWMKFNPCWEFSSESGCWQAWCSRKSSGPGVLEPWFQG